jgi:hypothetical protein
VPGDLGERGRGEAAGRERRESGMPERARRRKGLGAPLCRHAIGGGERIVLENEGRAEGFVGESASAVSRNGKAMMSGQASDLLSRVGEARVGRGAHDHEGRLERVGCVSECR